MNFSWAVAAALAVSAMVASLGPIALGVLIARKTGVGVRPWLYGALTFFLAQCVLRLPWQIPLALWVNKKIVGNTPAQIGWLAFCALTAALFEEVGRYVVIKTLIKGERSFRVGLMLGAGHGGLESMLLVGLSLGLTFGLYVAMGAAHYDFGMSQTAHDQTAKAFGALSATGALAGAVERVLSVTFHLGCSVLVMKGFIVDQRRWLAYAIGLHFAVDSIGVAAASWLTRLAHTPLAGELAILPFTLVAIAIIVRQGRATRPSQSSPGSAADPHPSP